MCFDLSFQNVSLPSKRMVESHSVFFVSGRVNISYQRYLYYYTHIVLESLMTGIRSNIFFGWEGCAEEVHIQGLKGCLQFFDKSPPHSALEFPTGLIPPQKPFILDLLSVETLFSERRNCIPSL